ncbi:Abi-alpha family protein [Caballeronia sp. LjRoot31]|uniref:Abi-alpha family protein n=1 Tax=Caballeronia sp. LjRoot31 TaxID=3342324 RepID=UPI003ED04408
MDTTTEVAKATQEVAKTTAITVQAVEKLGAFLSRFIGAPLDTVSGIVHDRLLFYRWSNQLDLMTRADQKLALLGIQKPTRDVPLKFAIPLLEAASLEDVAELRELWANLLVNAANSASHVGMHRAYIGILEQLSAPEAIVLEKIYSLDFSGSQNLGVYTGRLPERVEYGTISIQGKDLPEPTEEVTLALSLLARLGCISLGQTHGGPENHKYVRTTVLGREFVRACTLQQSNA